MALVSARLSGNVRLQNAANNQPPIMKGEQDKRAVEMLQHCLVELGADMPKSTKPSGLHDGIFGVETDKIVRDFQLRNGLKPDGIAGRDTLHRLDAIFAALVIAENAELRLETALPGRGWAKT